MLNTLEVTRCGLFFMLEAVECGLYLLEVLKVMHRVLLCMLGAVGTSSGSWRCWRKRYTQTALHTNTIAEGLGARSQMKMASFVQAIYRSLP